MFTKKTSQALSCLLIAILLVSCSQPKSLSFTGFRSFQVQPLSFASSRISCEVGVFNPNNFSIKVKNLDAAVSLAGKEVGKYVIPDTTILLPPNQPFYFPIQLEVSNGVLVGNMLSMLSGDSVAYSLTGHVRAGRKAGTFNFPFSHAGKISPNDLKF